MGYRQELRGRGANGIARGQGAREENEMHEAGAGRLWLRLGWHRAGSVDGLDHLDGMHVSFRCLRVGVSQSRVGVGSVGAGLGIGRLQARARRYWRRR